MYRKTGEQCPPLQACDSLTWAPNNPGRARGARSRQPMVQAQPNTSQQYLVIFMYKMSIYSMSYGDGRRALIDIYKYEMSLTLGIQEDLMGNNPVNSPRVILHTTVTCGGG